MNKRKEPLEVLLGDAMPLGNIKVKSKTLFEDSKDGEMVDTRAFAVVPFPVRLRVDIDGEPVGPGALSAQVQEGDVVEASYEDLGALASVHHAAVMGLRGSWPSVTEMRKTNDMLLDRLQEIGTRARVAVMPRLRNMQVGFYILMTPATQIQDLADMFEDTVAVELDMWTTRFPPAGAPIGTDSAFVSHLCVHPMFQSTPIGQSLLEDLIDQCIDYTTATRIELNTGLEKSAVHTLLHKHGFYMNGADDQSIRWVKDLPVRESTVEMDQDDSNSTVAKATGMAYSDVVR